MKLLDKVGFLLSISCAIHCTILPILLVSFPYFAISLFISEKFELYIIIASLILSISSVCLGLKKHKNFKIIPFLALGLMLLLVGKFIVSHDENSHTNIYIIFGGLIVGLSHAINYELCKKCKKCNLNEKY